MASERLPDRAGVGLKADHFDVVLANSPSVGWFEVHAENYMSEGGPCHHFLERIRGEYPLSIHGVGLSIGSSEPPDKSHLARLRDLLSRYQPAVFSEHLAWSSHGGVFHNDLLPLPYTSETLDQVCSHIDQVQHFLGRPILLENPATYVRFATSTMGETDFIAAVIARTGCGLLLDVNNVYVSAFNHGFPPLDYIAALPLHTVREIHLAGHAMDRDKTGELLLIDAHDRTVTAEVWSLYEETLRLTGPKPTLIEWDANLPEWEVLFHQACLADELLDRKGEARYGGVG